MTIVDLLGDRPVAYHPALARAVGGVGAGLLLCQFLYWSRTLPDARRGWFWKTAEQIQGETALTRCEQETARKKLKENKILQEKKMGMPAKVWFRVDVEKLEKLLKNQQGAGNRQSRMLNMANHDCGKPAIMDAEYPHTPETTPETTAETSAEKTTTPTPPVAGAGDGDGGGGLRPSDSLNAKTDIDDYLYLAMLYGGTKGVSPNNPAGLRAHIAARIAAAGGVLQNYERTQLEGWRRKAAATAEVTERAARDAAADEEKAKADDAAADEARRLDALYDALSPSERDHIDAMAMDRIPLDYRESSAFLLVSRRLVIAEMYPLADDRRLSEPVNEAAEQNKLRSQYLDAGVAARHDVRSPTRPRTASLLSREAQERARREELARQAKFLEAQER